jgi:hypothetical protein
MSRKLKSPNVINGLFDQPKEKEPDGKADLPVKTRTSQTRKKVAAIADVQDPDAPQLPHHDPHREQTPEEKAQEMIDYLFELESKVGFGLAVVLVEKQLPAMFWLHLTFEQWREIYKTAEGSELKERARNGMRADATQFWTLAFQYNETKNSEERQRIIKELAKNAFEFEQYVLVYQRTPASNPIKEQMLEYMKQNGRFNDWQQLFSEAKENQPLQNLAFERMLQTASLAQLAKLYQEATKETELKTRLFEALQSQVLKEKRE